MVVEGREMKVIEGEWLVKSLKQSSRKGIRMCFCETKVELKRWVYCMRLRGGTPVSASKAV